MKKTALLLYFIFCCLLLSSSVFAQTETVVETNSPAISEAQEMLRSNLHLQEQLHIALQAIEEARQDAKAASKETVELFTEKLNSVEKNLAFQRERDLASIVAMRESNRVALIGAAVLAGIGILALFVTAYFQVRAMNRVAEMTALISSGSMESQRALGNGNGVPVRLNSADQANARFLAAVEQLEKRIHEIDATNSNRSGVKMNFTEAQNADANGSVRPQVDFESADNLGLLLGKGQMALNNGDAEGALACFEEALKLYPESAEALVKKGSALEALRKLPEAIEAYDRAIATDNSLTVAYLYKGGVLNRLQRFAEAMQCYEQALGTPKKAA